MRDGAVMREKGLSVGGFFLFLISVDRGIWVFVGAGFLEL